jgi:hypothetical protein
VLDAVLVVERKLQPHHDVDRKRKLHGDAAVRGMRSIRSDGDVGDGTGDLKAICQSILVCGTHCCNGLKICGQ